MGKVLNVLVSAYACGPNWGSEIGMGWNWVINLSNYCQLTVITETGFEKDINKKIPELKLKYNPRFHFIDIGEKGRELFWKQGSFLFYWHYKKWQKEALALANGIMVNKKINILHQLNMIGFREPGFLWKIDNIPFVWGPVGGYNQVPWAYISKMNISNLMFYSVKNVINLFQIKLLTRPKKAAKSSTILFAANDESAGHLKKYINDNLIVLNETGCGLVTETVFDNPTRNKTLKILWVGRLQGLKALPIALETLSLLKGNINFNFTIVGDGPDEEKCKKLVAKLGLSDKVIWKGRIANDEVIRIMRNSDFLFFTSLKEGTPHVVTEAIQNGLPVLCHDSCGHGTVINEHCGVKIPMINFFQSVLQFKQEIEKFADNPKQLLILSKGAYERAHELSWDLKAKFMYQKYLEVLQQNEKNN